MPRLTLFVVVLAIGWGCNGRQHDDHVAPNSGSSESVAPGSNEYEWDLPPGFPTPQVPDSNPMSAAKVELGRHLFYDTRLSGNRTMSCATCHRQDLAFTDGVTQSAGSTGEVHSRNAMSLTNVAYNISFNWANPEVETLAAQALIPMFGTEPVELGLAGLEVELIERLLDDPYYRAAFPQAFEGEDPATVEHVVEAIATFVRTMISGGSPYDRYVFFDESEALSEAAHRGFELFNEAGCAECHIDFNLSGPTSFVGSTSVEVFLNNALYNVDGEGGYAPTDTGLFAKTQQPGDMGRFRVPTLRNIALTAPYMHDGSIATLSEVIDHYARGGRLLTDGPDAGDGKTSPVKSPLITGFELEGTDRADLIAFLHALTDEEFVADTRFADPWPQRR